MEEQLELLVKNSSGKRKGKKKLDLLGADYLSRLELPTETKGHTLVPVGNSTRD
jgi:hypothetical protein